MPASALPQFIVVGPSVQSRHWVELQEASPDLHVVFEPTLTAALDALRRRGGRAGYVALVRSDVIVNHQVQMEVERAVADPDLKGVPWLMLTSDGIGVDGELLDNGNYLDHATLAQDGPPRALATADPGVAVLALEALAGLDREEADDDDLTVASLIEAGWEAGLASYATPYLRFSVNAPREQHHRATGTTVAAGEPPLDRDEVTARLQRVRPDPTVTIVVRTTLNRNHLLRRTLASIRVASALRPVESVMVVGTLPRDELEAAHAELAERFPTVPLTVERAEATAIPSRSQCIMHAIDRATTDYVWFVDDDDMVTPESLDAIKNAVHAGERPLIVGASDVVEEHWEKNDTRPLLMWSQAKMRYNPHLWYRAFTGTNSVPICSLVIPREAAATRLGDVRLHHNLGEDFALLLLLLTSPGMSVVPVDYSIATVSIRPDADNVVTLPDRSGWLQSIGSFMSDLLGDPHAGSNVTWALGAAVRDSFPAAGGRHDMPSLVERIAELERDRAQLEQALATMRGYAARVQEADRGWKQLAKRMVPARLRPLARRVWYRLRS